MPFVTEYNTSLVFKKLIGEIPDDIRNWEPYRKSIYFLNRLDKTNLLYFKKFCENPIDNIDSIYKAIEVVDKKVFVYEGSKPSYHKYENCDRLSSNFVNYRIPTQIKEKGEEEIEKYRNWFKENESSFTDRPDVYQMRLQAKFGIIEGIQKVDYKNSGNVYKENLTLEEIQARIDSLLHNAAQFFKRNEKRQEVIKRFQTATFLAFKEEEIENNTTEYSDGELKNILKLYYYLFIEPTIHYLKEFFKTIYNADIEINERIFEALNFKKCGYCYSDKYEKESNRLAYKRQKLVEKFGEFEFPIEPTKFHFTDIIETNKRIAFIYCRVYRLISDEYKEDKGGKYKQFKIEYINHKNRFIYQVTKIYESDIPEIELFRKYITKIIQDKETKVAEFTTYAFEI
ncbi:hypothetical protein ULMA_00050 [Patiriisocius marinus]|uniref:Uncharacterized protein n=1 Tax=Patiriisocius marinus TaxID=1397112 RepID=A0A5J4J025_9FLAO|nr:hypothetical protein [Patiriisocius marinus]GER57897.1 hypothetical protein ULMA_00050 [Patiriisocius marinus]